MSTRRQVLRAAAYAAVATALGSNISCYAPEDVKPSKRIGTFEESAGRVVSWLRSKEWKIDALDGLEQFKGGLEFELDDRLYSTISTFRDRFRGQNQNSNGKRGVEITEKVEVNGHVFEINGMTGYQDTIVIFGKVKEHGKVGQYEVYVLENSFTRNESLMGSSIDDGRRVYLYDDHIAFAISQTEDELYEQFQGMGIKLYSMRNVIPGILAGKEVEWESFESLMRAAQVDEDTLFALIAMRLFYMDKNQNADTATRMSRLRAGVLMHELAHQELERTLGGEWKLKHMVSGELIPMLVELTYGTNQYYRLEHAIIDYLRYKRGQQTDAVYGRMDEWLTKATVGEHGEKFEAVAGLSEKELSRLFAGLLSHVSDQIGKHFGQLFDRRLMREAEEFISSMHLKEQGCI